MISGCHIFVVLIELCFGAAAWHVEVKFKRVVVFGVVCEECFEVAPVFGGASLLTVVLFCRPI